MGAPARPVLGWWWTLYAEHLHAPPAAPPDEWAHALALRWHLVRRRGALTARQRVTQEVMSGVEQGTLFLPAAPIHPLLCDFADARVPWPAEDLTLFTSFITRILAAQL